MLVAHRHPSHTHSHSPRVIPLPTPPPSGTIRPPAPPPNLPLPSLAPPPPPPPPPFKRRTSSLRDPLPNATPPVGDDGDDEDDYAPSSKRSKVKGRDGEEESDHSPSPQTKRRRTSKKNISSHHHNGSSDHSAGASPPSPSGGLRGYPPPPHSARGRPANLSNIKPIGFAASREAKREDGLDHGVPSPVVMGFDFKSIDEAQLRTVRNTISIKEQQQALIAQRQRDSAATTPVVPRELTFKDWQPKGSASSSVGKRREKTREKVEKMSIVTSNDKDVHSGSKSAPLGPPLSAQQASPREPPSGSQTAVPPHVLPSIPAYANGMDPRTAPLQRNGEEEYRQAAFYRGHSHRPSYSGPGEVRESRRNFTMPNSAQPLSQARFESVVAPQPPRPVALQPSASTSPSRRQDFLQPFSRMYDFMSQMEQLRYSMIDLQHRSEDQYQLHMNAMSEFKATAAQASALLTTLQASAESLKDMVRYEINRAESAEKKELEDLRERVRRLEQQGQAAAASASAPAPAPAPVSSQESAS